MQTKTVNRDKSYYVEGIAKSNIAILSQAITLCESDLPKHQDLADEIIDSLSASAGNSIRIGITGTPGVGKSTFIESFGLYLCSIGKKVAVLAVDPSSEVSGGSILGDKTRMEQLVREPNAFIRPTPSAGNLGGVARKTKDTIILCEAAGFDVIIIETVGVGQSETEVQNMTDYFVLMVLPGGGDELQSIKKGIVEISDIILINKADGEHYNSALMTQKEYKTANHYSKKQIEILLISALESKGIENVWQIIEQKTNENKANGIFNSKRQNQIKISTEQTILDSLIQQIQESDKYKSLVESVALEIENKGTFSRKELKDRIKGIV